MSMGKAAGERRLAGPQITAGRQYTIPWLEVRPRAAAKRCVERSEREIYRHF